MFSNRNRSRSRKRGTYPIDGNHLVDARSKQLLFNEFEISPLGKTTLRGDELFSNQSANNLLEKHLKKKRGMILMSFLVDRIRFGGKSGSGRMCTREYLSYREIKYIFRYSAQPTLFTLGIEDEQSPKRSYKTYMCKSVHDMEPIHELIQRATTDPQYLLRCPVRVFQDTSSTSNDSSPNVYEREIHRPTFEPNSTMEQTKPVYSMYEDPESCNVCNIERESSPCPNDSPLTIERHKVEPSEMFYSPPRLIRRQSTSTTRCFQSTRDTVPLISNKLLHSSPDYNVTSTQCGPRTPSLRRKSHGACNKSSRYRSQCDLRGENSHSAVTSTRCFPLSSSRLSLSSYHPEQQCDATWKSPITYLSKNCNQEPEVSERGPVFMYVSRNKRESSFQTD